MINVDSTINPTDSEALPTAPGGDPIHLGAAEAAAFLGVKRETLYAYTSRGLLRSLPGDGKERRYHREDLERLKTRHDARSGHGPVAGAALRWGEPVLESALTGIDASGPRYRGHPATALARDGVPFEHVAELLWTGVLPPGSGEGAGGGPAAPSPTGWSFAPPPTGRPAGSPADPVTLAAVPLRLAADDPDPAPGALHRELARARQLVAALADAVGPYTATGTRIAERLAHGLGVPHGAAALDRALVVMADHELNASSFAARVVASTGADLYAVVAAALCALSGPLHGGACARVEALVAEVVAADRAGAVVAARGRRGEAIPGFGHPLYPQGDPRATVLLEDARALGDTAVVDALVAAMAARGEHPTVDVGLVALQRALGAPAGTAAAVFAIGRSAGWIAHALEQRTQRVLLRPRARYTGP